MRREIRLLLWRGLFILAGVLALLASYAAMMPGSPISHWFITTDSDPMGREAVYWALVLVVCLVVFEGIAYFVFRGLVRLLRLGTPDYRRYRGQREW